MRFHQLLNAIANRFDKDIKISNFVKEYKDKQYKDKPFCCGTFIQQCSGSSRHDLCCNLQLNYEKEGEEYNGKINRTWNRKRLCYKML